MYSIQKLPPYELLILLSHLLMGKDHLDSVLTESESKQIYQLETVSAETKEKLKSNSVELTSKAVLAINTIFTGVFGAWMGLSGFFKFPLSSPLQFGSILAFSICLGIYLSYQNMKQLKDKAKDAVDKRKLQNICSSIIHNLSRKRKVEINEKKTELKNLLGSLNIAKIVDYSRLNQNCLEWLDKLQPELPEEFVHETQLHIQTKIEQEEMKLPLVQKLAKSNSKPPMRVKSWIRENYRELISGLIPTLIGFFSATFVYLGGIPRIAKALGHIKLYEILKRPDMKVLQFVMAVCFVLYLAYSYIQVNRRSYRRDQEISTHRLQILHAENAMILLDDDLLKIKEMLLVVERFKKNLAQAFTN